MATRSDAQQLERRARYGAQGDFQAKFAHANREYRLRLYGL
jgi:hypothetical protein